MLIRFSVENFRSIRDEMVLTLSPVPRWKKHTNHILRMSKNKSVDVLPVAAIYGANASGKSNLINAMAFMRNFVCNDRKPDAPIGIIPFLLDRSDTNEPRQSRFEIVCRIDDVVYTYGFVADSETVREEWLFAYYSNRESKVFERITKNSITYVEPGERLLREEGKGKQYIQFVARGTRANKLFLSEAYERNLEAVIPLRMWFAKTLHIITPNSQYQLLESKIVKDPLFASFISQTMSKLDLGFEGITFQEEELSANNPLNIPREILDSIVADIKDNPAEDSIIINDRIGNRLSLHKKADGSIKSIILKTLHHRNDGTETTFDLSFASDGTKRLLNLVPMLQTLAGNNQVFVIDELDRSLHTLLSRNLIVSLLELVANGTSKSQLVFTTHDTNLLDSQLLRSDEIWFLEKNPKTQGSEITSLSDFRISDGLNFERGYIMGRFGGIPYFGDRRRLP